ncbi:hypothetical protein SOPP22_13115 [Shewanella sp. OPT22]|nr:hypothetical protein SOPP22_13115 [Shewanella sp. OPT22]
MAAVNLGSGPVFDIDYTNKTVKRFDDKRFTEQCSDFTNWQQVEFRFNSEGNRSVSKTYQVRKVSNEDGQVSFILRESHWIKRLLPTWMVGGTFRDAIDQKLPVFEDENKLRSVLAGDLLTSENAPEAINLAQSVVPIDTIKINPIEGSYVGGKIKHYLNLANRPRDRFKRKVHLPNSEGVLQKRIKSIDDQFVAEADFNISFGEKETKITATTSISSLLPEITVSNPTIILGVEDVLLKRVFEDEQHLFPTEPEQWVPQTERTIAEIKRIKSEYPEAKFVFFSELDDVKEKLSQAGFTELDYKVVKRQEENYLNSEHNLQYFLENQFTSLTEVICMTSSLRIQQAILSIGTYSTAVKCPIRHFLMLDKDQSRMKRSVKKLYNVNESYGYETAKERMFDLKDDAVIEHNIHNELQDYTEEFRAEKRQRFLENYKIEEKVKQNQRRVEWFKELRNSFGEMMDSYHELIKSSEYQYYSQLV